MPVKAIPKFSVARNGLGAFLLPCRRITLQFCNWGGSSKGIREFLKYRLPKVAAENPKIEFKIVKKSGHPVATGTYNKVDREKAICVRNLNIDEVENKIKLLLNSSGAQLKKHKQPVESLNVGVRGIWSPFHVNPTNRHKI